MLDTVTLKYHDAPTPIQLEEWCETTQRYPTGSCRKKYSKRINIENDVSVLFTHYPQNPGFSHPISLIEFSVPKVLFGNNSYLIRGVDEIYEAASRVNGFISGLSWMCPINVLDGILSRIDLTYDHHIGNTVEAYIHVLMKSHYPRRKTIIYPNEGVLFKSRTASTKFYDKHKEQGFLSAGNLLRQETTFRRTYTISRRMGIDNPTLMDITPEWVIQVLHQDLERLTLNNRMICTSELALEMLMNKYSPNTALKLLGYLLTRQSNIHEQMIANGTSKSTIWRWNIQLKEVGICLALTDAKYALPPLTIDKEYFRNETLVVSDTRTQGTTRP